MELKIFCCIAGSDRPFSVDMLSSLTVDDLKEAIKQKRPNDLKSIDSATLDLFEVSFKSGPSLAKQVKDEVKFEKPLKPTRKLSKIFPNEPPEKTIHIVVRLPDDAGESFAFGPIPPIHLPLYRLHLQSNLTT
ncbi:hypothetical protein K435DRAFT_378695 [Dendrothele bispora CBS 962.96]|uniref:Crinkler effector protein N-terminal domain-containing protein n=1 Tax=Dendrothele bispora (strain CBS 962.96) TaxID=1314807 RepID=A0A4V4HD48_DENBC|nr:hypothetical protein K435DRAFT_378695 [Dendrothele bispora CBS 962.96]